MSRRDPGPPATGPTETDVLTGFLDYLRHAVAAKATGLDETTARTPGVDSGTNLLGLVKHLTHVERYWLLGQPVTDWPATFHLTDTETATRILADYRTVTAEATAVTSTWDDLTAPGPRPTKPGQTPPTRRWTLVHLVEETARHAGHADILREHLDGTTGR